MLIMKKRNRRNLIVLPLLLMMPLAGIFAQDEEPDNRPIKPPFETLTLIDNQTTVNPYKGSLQLEISHRFSKIEDISDLFGIYSFANTRLAMDYGITDKIMVGFGTTNYNKMQDFEWKYSILTQTRSGSIPLSLSYYGNMVIDAREFDEEYFGPEDQYKFMHRMSYLTQLIASRKMGPVSLQVIPTFAYFNGVQQGYNNINYGISVGGRAQVLGMSSIVFEYDQPLSQHEDLEVYPNVSLGVEIGTSTHSFRIFVANYSDIVKQRNMFYNTSKDFRFGFNISVRLR